MIKIPIKKRFINKVHITSDCWEWEGSISRLGYGHFGIGSRTDKSRKIILAHRFSWEIHNGKIPEGIKVLHHCDNRKCVKPMHLFLGTQKDNMQDCRRKGRGKNPPILAGEKAPWAKLNDFKVKEIRSSIDSTSSLAKTYGVSPGLISMVKKRQVWKHVS